jgi:hypothetical protein
MQPQKRTHEVSTGIFVLVPNDPALYTHRGIPAHYSSFFFGWIEPGSACRKPTLGFGTIYVA